MAITRINPAPARAKRAPAPWPAADDPIYTRLGAAKDRLQKLTSDFGGELVWPWSPDYDRDRQEANPIFQAYPILIAYCESSGDVQIALEAARTLGWWTTCRSGGHSTAGYSVNDGGMVLDVSRINGVSIDASAMTATVGAGCNFDTLNAALDAQKLHVPGGGCGDVCIGGFMQGGGYGFTSRQYGMNCDNVVAFTMVLADGTLVVADESQDSDLFWAVRGGTGNNFGVLIDVTYRLSDLYALWGFGLQWRLADAPAALVELQQNYMASGAPSRLGYQTFLATTRGTQALVMLGLFNGTRADGLQAIASLQKTGSPALIVDQTGTYAQLNESILVKTLTPPTATCRELKQSGYIAQPLSQAQWGDVVKYFATTPNEFNMVGLETYGGAINAYPMSGNAFIHRNVDCNFFIDSFFDDAGQITTQQAAATWLNGLMSLMQPHFNGEVYQNYPVQGLANFRQAYWGSAFDRLLSIKGRYDPHDFFHFEQSISPPPASERIEPGVAEGAAGVRANPS